MYRNVHRTSSMVLLGEILMFEFIKCRWIQVKTDIADVKAGTVIDCPYVIKTWLNSLIFSHASSIISPYLTYLFQTSRCFQILLAIEFRRPLQQMTAASPRCPPQSVERLRRARGQVQRSAMKAENLLEPRRKQIIPHFGPSIF